MNPWQVAAVLCAVLAFLGALLSVGNPQAVNVLAIGSITLAVVGQTAPVRRT